MNESLSRYAIEHFFWSIAYLGINHQR